MRLLGIDIGGTKTQVCVGTSEGEVLASKRMPTVHGNSLDAYFEGVERACRQAMTDSGTSVSDIEAIGISAPGPLSVRDGVLIAPPNNPGWRDVPVVKRVRDMFKLPVFMDNDANAAALAEHMFGQYRGTKNLVYLTFSTGMGGGIIANGKLVQGISDMGGEIGHQTLDLKGPKCACGKTGCFEAYVGGRTLAERLKEKIRVGGISTSIVAKAGGKIENVDTKAFFDAAREGDPFALAEWEEFTERLAQGVANVMMILNPEVIVLGTMAVREGDFVLKPLREKVRKYAWPWTTDVCTIAASSLGAKVADLAAMAVAIEGLKAG